MANPNPDVWGAPETWIQEQNVPAVEGTGYDVLKAIKPRIANFGSNNGTLGAGNTAGKTPINQSLDATVCPCGQDAAISPFAKIRMFKNKQNAAQNAIPEQTIITENNVCNWFLFDGSGGYWQGWNTDHFNENANFCRWLPNAVTNNNLNIALNPYVYWQTKSILIYVTVFSIASYSNGCPNYAEIPLSQWKSNYQNRKIADIRLNFLCVDSANSNGISYKNTAATYSEKWGGIAYIGQLYDSIENYPHFAKKNILAFDVFGHCEGNYYASSAMFTMNSADMFNNVELKGGVINYNTERGWQVWFEIPYSEDNYNKVLSIASLFGCCFTPTNKRSFDIDFADNDLYLPVLDNRGIAHGNYTHGADNANNPFINANSVRDFNYNPYYTGFNIYLGDKQIDKIYLGDREIDKVYLGDIAL